MRKWVALLCLLALYPACILAPAQAEGLVHTGASGFTLTLPAGWEILIGGDEDDFDFFEDLSPGEEEALFSSGDGMIWVTVLHADDTPVNPYAVEALLNEAAMEARVGPVNGYQKLFYEFDEANRRAFILYALVADEGGVRYVEYLVGFITGSDIAQFLLITVREDQLEARFPLISEIVNGIDVGGVREGAEG